MYKPKFQYHSLSRHNVDGSRIYATPDGEKLPSVTTILDKTKSEERKTSLLNWKKRTGFERAQQITTEAANRGTKMHTFLEHYIKDNALQEAPQNPFHKPSWHMANHVINGGLSKCSEFWGIEVPLYFPKVYAGTTDCIGIHDNIESIIDFKQTNKPKKREWIEDYFLQLCAYAVAHNEVYGTNISRGVVMMCVKPDIDSSGNMTKAPEYQQFILEGEEFKKYENLWWQRVEMYYLSI